MQNQAASLILEGVFDAFPGAEGRADRGRLRLGAATLAWRLDAHWAKMRDEVPD